MAFGISDDTLHDVEPKGRSAMPIALPIGILAGTVFTLVDPIYVLVALALLLLTALLLSVPESGALLLFVLLPLSGFFPHGMQLFLFLFFLLFVGYLIKWICGNRTFKLEAQDFPVLLLLTLFFFSALSAAGAEARASAWLSVVALIAYFLMVNMLATPGWLLRSRVALAVSGTISALIGIVQFITTAVGAPVGTTLEMLGASVKAGFADSVSLVWFLTIAFAFLFPALWELPKKPRLFGIGACILMLIATVLTRVPCAPVAIGLVMLLFALLHDHRALPITLLGGGFLTALVKILPPAVSERFIEVLRASDSFAEQRRNTARVLARIFFGDGNGAFDGAHGLRRFLFGLGRGGMDLVYPAFTDTGTAFEPALCNFFTGFVAEFGVVGLIVPLLLFFLVLQNCFTALAEAHARDVRQPAVALTGICLTGAAILFACFHYTWANPIALGLAAEAACSYDEKVSHWISLLVLG